LALVLPRADDEVVGDGGDGVDVEDERVRGRRVGDDLRDPKRAVTTGRQGRVEVERVGDIRCERDGIDGSTPSAPRASPDRRPR
jgi:hypothetical protein